MIILEGVDGSGKTTLLSNLLDQFPSIEEHARASASVGGPLDNIQDWAREDMATQMIQPLSFYDRHPMFSEPIYGAIIRNYVHPWFNSDEAQEMGDSFLRNNLIVICLPPLENVLENVKVEDQMPGVHDHIEALYNVYRQTITSLQVAFPHNVFHYDYTNEEDLDDLVTMVAAHQTRYLRKQNGRIA